jgi:hypothetical protein
MWKDLDEWVKENVPDDDLLYGKGLASQVNFVRNEIPSILAISYQEVEGIRKQIRVVSTHTSKSVTLPVFQFDWDDYKFTMRNNFHDWKVSVHWVHEWQNIADIDFGNVVSEGLSEPINSVYCEGFRENAIYGSVEEARSDPNKWKRGFTVSIGGSYSLWTFFWLIERRVRDKKRIVVRPDHQWHKK